MSMRLTIVTVLGLATIASWGLAQTMPASAPAAPNPQAEALNDQGKTLFSDKKDYAAAADKFQQAIAIQPEARYFYNLCFAFEKEEQYEKAVEACDDVFTHNPPAALGDKAGQKSAEIRSLMKEKGQEPPPPPPNVPPPSSQPVAPPPAAPVEDAYKWAVGGELGLAIRAGLGNANLNGAGLGAHAYADLMLSKRLGAQIMIGAAAISGKGNEDLVINDYGLGIYGNIKLAHHLYVTPLAGVNLSFQAPFADGSTAFFAIGARLRAELDILLNSSDVITIAPEYTEYFGASKLVGTDAPSIYGLDKAGGIFSISIGYTRRSTSVFTAANLGLE
jgi:tetratricopeptide (TPR) repeat protein